MSARQSAIDVFEKRSADFAAMTTFGFDPVYFERRLLRSKALEGASRILVFMDAAEWCKLLERREPARHLNNRYLVVPVAMGTGVFHPKVVLLLGSDGVTVACNSANLTKAGFSHNLELLNAGHSTFDKPEAVVIKVAEKILDLLKDACSRSWSRGPARIAKRSGSGCSRRCRHPVRGRRRRLRSGPRGKDRYGSASAGCGNQGHRTRSGCSPRSSTRTMGFSADFEP